LRDLAVFLLLWTLPAQARGNDLRAHKQARYLMGTVCEITVYAGDDQAESALDAAFTELKRIDSLLSNWKEDSELMRMNRAAAALTGDGKRPEVPLGEELFERLRVAINLASETGGLFDPTVGPLVRAWGFLPAEPSGQTRETEIQAAKQRVGWKNIELDVAWHKVRFKSPGMEIDLGGIAKGYAAGRAAQVLRRRGITSAFINLGGSSMVAIGSPPGRRGWPVMIRDPRDGETPAAEFELHDGEAVATSGTYEKTVGEGKGRRSHIMNPATGEAVAGATSVTIVMDEAETADALTKPFFFLAWPPAKDWARLLERHPKASVILMAARGEELVCQRGGAHPERFFGLPNASSRHHAAKTN
jgi:thiamine biosynthesis lipoprotein